MQQLVRFGLACVCGEDPGTASLRVRPQLLSNDGVVWHGNASDVHLSCVTTISYGRGRVYMALRLGHSVTALRRSNYLRA
jgi:hypothetical protein